ncbi:hypothetical protein ATCC90586_009266 [Pythium insidiosum]|nr:hypothetical protein ATCC90586_009266 [Pythium insidiosum]
MGQAESSSSPPRVEPRWSRVPLEQLRDEEFLAKQLRRIETIARARQAASVSGARRHRQPPRRLFADATATRSAALSPTAAAAEERHVPWTRSLFPSDDKAAAADEDGDTTEPEPPGGRKASPAASPNERDDRREEQLLNLLVVFGAMPHAKRTALLRCHLQDVVERGCVAPDPIAELVSLRLQILRSICEASLLQQQLQHQTDAASAALAQSLMSSSLLLPQQSSCRPLDAESAKEANAAGRVFTDFLGLILDPSATPTAQQTKDVFVTVLPFIDELHALSLAPAARSTGAREASSPSGDDAASRLLISRLQRLLQQVALGGLPPKATSPRSEFGLADRTAAIAALIRLAVAAGSLRHLLQVVMILLGAGDTVDSSRPLHEGSLALGDVSSGLASPTTSPNVSLLKSARAREVSAVSHPPSLTSSVRGDPIAVSEDDNDGTSDERADYVSEASALVEQKLKQVHKQRLDAVAKGDIDTQVTVDQLLTHAKRRTGPKGMALKVSVANASTAAGSSVSLAGHRVSTGAITGAAGSSKAKLKDDLNNFDIAGGFDSLKDDPHRPSRAEMPPSDTPQQVAVCPRLHPLYVGHVLRELDDVKPSSVPETLQRGRVRAARGVEMAVDGGLEVLNSSMLDEREVWSCGQNSYGELGHGDTTTRKSFERVEALQRKEIIQVCAGNEHSIALSADGSVWTCGYNDNGQCGLGVTTRVSHLTELQKLVDTPIAQVHAYNGCEHTVLVTQDGRAATCGYNYRGQLGHGNTQSETIPKMLRSLESKTVRLVSCSYYHTVLACHGAGGQAIVYTFGRNDYGQLGHNDTLDRKLPQQVDALLDHHVQVVSVACGQYHTMLVTSTGRLLGFGKNDYGQLGLDSAENQLVPVQVRGGLERQTCLEVRCGYYHTIVLCAGAHLYGFGRNDYGQLGLGRATNSASTNGQLQQQRFPVPQLIEDLEGKEIVRFACGCYHTVAVSDNGVLYVFGRNNHGQLGTGDTNERLYPYPIDDFVGKRVAMVAAGFYHTLVLTGGTDDSDAMDADDRAIQKPSGRDEEQDKQDDDTSLAVASLNSAVVLSNPSVRSYLAMTARDVAAAPLSSSSSPSIFDGLETGELRRPTAKSDGESCNDPTVEADGEESRVDGSTSQQKHERFAHPATSAPSTRSAIVKSKRPALDPVDIAVIIVAEVDRLAQPFLLNKNPHPVATMAPAVRAPSETSDDAEDDDVVVDLFPGAFVSYVVQLSPSTFDTLNTLLSHLSTRRLDVTHAVSQSSPAFSVQAYLIVALLRVLHANLAQLSRSGIAALLRQVPRTRDEVATENEGPVPASRRVILRLLVSLQSTRDVLCGLLDRRSPLVDNSDSAGAPRAVVSSAIDCLMSGFEVFFPCSCTQVALVSALLRTGGDSPTSRMIAESAVSSAATRTSSWTCISLWRWVPATAGVRQLLLKAVLRRMADDTVMTRLLQGSLSCAAPKASPPPTTPLLKTLYLALLDRLNTEFIHALGDLSSCARSVARPLTAGPVVSPTAVSAGSGDAIHWLIALQKHLTAAALGCKSWTRQWSPTDPSATRSTC